MEIKDFKVEQWMNAWETTCRYNVAETCTYSVTLNQLFDICDGDGTEGSGRAARDPLRVASRRFRPGSAQEPLLLPPRRPRRCRSPPSAGAWLATGSSWRM